VKLIYATILVLAPMLCCAQSWTPVDRLGVGQVKHWDDIRNTSSPAEVLDSISKPTETPSSLPSAAVSSNSPFYERRMLPEASALKVFFDQLLAEKDDRVVKTAGLRLQLPDSVKWFTEVFGADAAVPLEKEYSSLRAGWVKQFGSLLKGVRGRGQTSVAVQLVRGANDPDASPAQRQVLAAMKQSEPLYTLRFINPATREQYVMYSFAYVDGAFRYVGKLNALTTRQAAIEPAASNQ
jgi:hypothetical protein